MKFKILIISISILVILVINPIFFIVFQPTAKKGMEKNNKGGREPENPSPSATTTLDYNQYVSVYYTTEYNDQIDWSFSGDNQYVGIIVYAMEEEEYLEFQSGGSPALYTLSSGDYVSDSGTFTVAYDDVWYIVFLNEDSDQQSTYLTYSAAPQTSSTSGDDDSSSSSSSSSDTSSSSYSSLSDNLFTYIIIIIGIIGFICFMYAGYHYISNAKSPQEAFERWHTVNEGANSYNNSFAAALRGDQQGFNEASSDFNQTVFDMQKDTLDDYND